MAAAALAPLIMSGCMTAYKQSVGTDHSQVFRKIYKTDLNTAWQSVLDALKSSPIDVSNREGGYIRTKWTDNTAERNFTDSFGPASSFLKAEYRFRVSVAKGFYNGIPIVKVSVQKDQRVQRDLLEGWKPIETDSIDENTLIYRIGRIISMRMKIAQIEEEKTRLEIEQSGKDFGFDPQ